MRAAQPTTSPQAALRVQCRSQCHVAELRHCLDFDRNRDTMECCCCRQRWTAGSPAMLPPQRQCCWQCPAVGCQGRPLGRFQAWLKTCTAAGVMCCGRWRAPLSRSDGTHAQGTRILLFADHLTDRGRLSSCAQAPLQSPICLLPQTYCRPFCTASECLAVRHVTGSRLSLDAPLLTNGAQVVSSVCTLLPCCAGSCAGSC